MSLKHFKNILKLIVNRIIIFFVILCIESVLPTHYKQKNTMLVDFDYMVSQIYVQHCTFVEVGEGVCSLFVELTLDLGSSCKKPTSRQMFFGNCLCSEFRGWQLCSHQLASQRPDDCVFEEGEDCPSSSARVHRRLCDITGMSQWNTQCNCSVPLAAMQQEPLCGFRTCFANPMPASICTPRTVCGTARCDISLHGSLYAVKCDRRCKDHQSFCELTGPATSKKRVVTSEWTQWQSLSCEDKASIQQFEAECLDTEGNPAFDCIGPGLLCCGSEEVDCICEVKQEDGHLKVFRYAITLLGSKESEHLSLRVRSIAGLKGQAKVWNRFIDMASKEEESNSLFSSPKLKNKKNKEKLQVELLNIGKLEPKGNQINVHTKNHIMYENISQLLQGTIPPFTQLIATAVSNNNLQHQPLMSGSIPDKQEKKNNLIDPSINSLKHPGEQKKTSFINEKEERSNLSSLYAAKSQDFDLGKNSQSSIDDSEMQEQIKEEIRQYHFTQNPNSESKKQTTTTESTANNEKYINFNDHINEENHKFTEKNDVKIDDLSKNSDDKEGSTFLQNKENKNTISENKKILQQELETSNSHNHNLKPENNDENNDSIDNEISSQTDKKILQNNEKYFKSDHKDSLTDNKMPMDQNFFQNEIDYNGRNVENNKNNTTDETLTNHSLDYSSTSITKPNLQNNPNFENLTQNVEQNRTYLTSEYRNVNEYATTVEINPSSTSVAPEFTASINKNSISCNTEKENGEKNSSEAKVSKKNEEHGEDVSFTETNMPTNKSNIQSNNNLNNKGLLSNDTETKTLADESKFSKHPTDRDSTTTAITKIIDYEPIQNLSNMTHSKEYSSTEIPTITKVNCIAEPKTLNTTNQESQIKSTQYTENGVHGKLTKSKEHILMDQKEALQTVSNLNPTLALDEDVSKAQNSLYDEPEPVLKDLDKDVVDDNMSDVLNNMIGMKHVHDKLTWTEKKDDNKKINSKEDKFINSNDIKHSSQSKGFASSKGDLGTNEHSIKTKKTKKKIH